MKAFITGITGFAGSYLSDLLEKKGYKIFGISLEDSDKPEVHKGDINNKDLIYSLLSKIRPDVIYHLAATTSVGKSWEIPGETIKNNFLASFNIIEWVREVKPDTKLFIMGSAEIYGEKNDLPIKESAGLETLSPYSLSKYFTEKTSVFYKNNFGINLYISRAFNFTGPGQRSVFVVSSFTKRLVEMEKGIREKKLKVGNLSAKRDFTDVRDTVKAIYLITEKGKPGKPYNIASGRSYSIKEILDILLSLVDIKVKIIRKSSKFRKNDIRELKGDFSELKKDTGWTPEIPLEKTLKDTLFYWRKKMDNE